tara:strand:- start:13591 stop:15777 length:2187 start_codon:yes stop_codon:yes gene_type:complete
MPAGPKFKSKIIITLSLITVLLSACSRDNPLSIPDKYIEESETFCINDGPYSGFTLLNSINITNTTEVLPIDYPRGFNNSLLKLTAPFLISQANITPNVITDSSINDETVLIVTEKQKKSLLDFYLLQNEISFIDESIPEIITIGASVSYPKSGAQENVDINEERLFVTSDLEYGKNLITTKVIASIKVPRTTIDCENPLTEKELEEEGFEEDASRYKVIQVIQSFPVELTRQSIDELEQSELNTIVSNSENDQFGRVISLNENFLVIGIPNEDTLAKGIISSESFITKEDAENTVDLEPSQNEGALNSGAVYLYKKSGLNSWDFHSFIKSSNNEPGDLFGSAVALNDTTLVISAPGEASIASGIHNSLTSETENLKINNLAPSSGAVYIFEFDAITNSWSEKYYIKPNKNLISDGDYNKGFGSQLAIYDTKLLISAPLEDSDNGDPGNSNQPNSGAVYIYTITPDMLSFGSVIKAFNPDINDKFGSEITLNDKFIVVSSPFEDQDNQSITNNFTNIDSDVLINLNNNKREDSGSVYIFEHSLQNQVTTFTTHIKSSNSDEFDFFGTSISISNNKLFVGAIGEDSSGKGLNRDMKKNDNSDSGAVYMFSYNPDNMAWVEATYIKANDSQSDASFGKYLVATKDNLIVSAPLFDYFSDTNAGKAYFYYLTDNEVYQEFLFLNDKGASSEMRFGSRIATHGRSLAIGASGFIDKESSVDKNFAGTLFTYE